MFHPDWPILIALATGFVVAWLVRGAIARRNEKCRDVEWRVLIDARECLLTVELIHLFGKHHGLNERYAALTAANQLSHNRCLGPALQMEFALDRDDRRNRWMIKLGPRQPKEPRVDLSEEAGNHDLSPES